MSKFIRITVFAIAALAFIVSCTNTHDLLKKRDEGWQKVDIILERIKPPPFKSQEFLVTDHGLTGNSSTDNSKAMDQLIRLVNESGGGTIRFPKGNYFFDGPIHLLSDIHLHLDEDALIFFSSNPESYLPAVKVRWEGTVCYNYSPLIYGYQSKNMAITGAGTIDGAALEWSKNWRKAQNPDKDVLRKMGSDEVPEEQRVFGNGYLDLNNDGQDDGYGDGKQHYLRPTLIEFYECENILISGVIIKNSPFWTVHPVFSKNITIDGIQVYGETVNDDGIDPDSSEDVLIQNCLIQTHDDAISIKAGRDQDAWNRSPSKDIIVRKNKLYSGVNALCVGSEMSGGVENIFAYDNVIQGGKHAINFKCNLDRGGEVKNIFIKNLEIESCGEAMFIFRMDYHGYRGNKFPTKFRDFYVSDIHCKSVDGTAFKIVGVPEEPIKNVLLKDIIIEKSGESTEIQHAENIAFDNVFVNGNKL